jgi:hypothetical protein
VQVQVQVHQLFSVDHKTEKGISDGLNQLSISISLRVWLPLKAILVLDFAEMLGK